MQVTYRSTALAAIVTFIVVTVVTLLGESSGSIMKLLTYPTVPHRGDIFLKQVNPIDVQTCPAAPAKIRRVDCLADWRVTLQFLLPLRGFYTVSPKRL